MAPTIDLVVEAEMEAARLKLHADKMKHALAKSMEISKEGTVWAVEDDYKTVTYPTISTTTRFGYGYVSPSMPPQKDHLQDMANAITNKDAQKYAAACAALWKANVS